MKTIIYNGIDMLGEAMTLLLLVARDENCLENMERLISKYKVSPKQLKTPFTVADQLVKLTKKKLSGKLDKVRFYFAPLNAAEEMINLASFAVSWDALDYETTLESKRSYCMSLSEEERCRDYFLGLLSCQGFADKVFEDGMNGIDLSVCTSFKELFDFLNMTEFTIEQKWQLQWMFIHYEEAFDEVGQLLSKAVEALEEMRPQWEPLVQEFYTCWSERIKTATMADYVREQLQLTMEESATGSVVLPWITGVNSFAAHIWPEIKGMAKTQKDVFRIGTSLEYTGILTTEIAEDARRRHAISILKMLADESKLEILTLLKKKKYYGGELARELNLTTATISYHMNNLLLNNMVVVSKERNKVYYQLNEVGVQDALGYINELFVKEGTTCRQ